MKKTFKKLLLTFLLLINAPLLNVNAYTYDRLNGLNFTTEFTPLSPAAKDYKSENIWNELAKSFNWLNPPIWNHLHETDAVDFKTKNHLNDGYVFGTNSGPTIFRKYNSTNGTDQLFLQKTVMVFCKSKLLDDQYKTTNYIQKNVFLINEIIDEIRNNNYLKPSNFNTCFLRNPNLSFKRYIQKYDLYHFFSHQQIIHLLSQDFGYVKEVHIVINGQEESFYYDHGKEINKSTNPTGAPDKIYIVFAIDGVKYNITENFGLSKNNVPNITDLFIKIGLTPPTTAFTCNFLYTGKLGTFEIGIEMQLNKNTKNWLYPKITHRFFNPIQMQNGYCSTHNRWNCTHGAHNAYGYDSHIHNNALPFPNQTGITTDLQQIATTVNTILTSP